MNFPAFILLALSIAVLETGICQAQQAPQQPVEKAAPPRPGVPACARASPSLKIVAESSCLGSSCSSGSFETRFRQS